MDKPFKFVDPPASPDEAEHVGNRANDSGDDSADDSIDAECSICTLEMTTEFARPEPCYHRFHSKCISTWSRVRLSCPLCRKDYKRVYRYSLPGNKIEGMDEFQEPEENILEQIEMTIGIDPYAHTVCQICHGGDDEDLIILCDACDDGFHTYCLTPQLPAVPRGSFFCQRCQENGHRPGSLATLSTMRTVGRSRVTMAVHSQLTSILDSLFDEFDEESDDEEELDYPTDNFVLRSDQPGPSRIQPTITILRKAAKGRRKKNKTILNTRRRMKKVRAAQRNQRRRVIISSSESDNDIRASSIKQDEPGHHHSDDIVTQILADQERTLANGNLFKQEDGRFVETEQFRQYRTNFHSKMSSEHKQRIGMPADTETVPHWAAPSCSNPRERNIFGFLPAEELDLEVYEQIHGLKQEKELNLYEAQQKALADQKRESMQRSVTERRNREVAERIDKRKHHAEEEEARRLEKIKAEKEKIEKKERERKERHERRRMEEKARKEEEERKLAISNNERRYHESRKRHSSPKERRRREEKDKSRGHNSDSRSKPRDKQDRHTFIRNDSRERNSHMVSSTSDNVALPNDISMAAFPPFNPLFSSFGLQQPLGVPNMNLLPMIHQPLIHQMPNLPLGFNPIVPGNLGNVGNSTLAISEKIKKEKYVKDRATKLIESHSIDLAKQYYKARKITRAQYSEVMKSLMSFYRKSHSVDELKSSDVAGEIRHRAKELLETAAAISASNPQNQGNLGGPMM